MQDTHFGGSAMRREPNVLLLVLTVALLSAAAGCGDQLRNVTARPDVLRVSYATDPDTLNPLTAGDATSDFVQGFVYEALAERNLAEPDELLLRLAEKWEFD